MWTVAVRKLWHKKGNALVQILGLALAVALTAAVPLYAGGALGRIVDDALQKEADKDAGLPPGALTVRYQAVGREVPPPEAVKAFFAYLDEALATAGGLPLLERSGTYGLRPLTFTRLEPPPGRNADEKGPGSRASADEGLKGRGAGEAPADRAEGEAPETAKPAAPPASSKRVTAAVGTVDGLRGAEFFDGRPPTDRLQSGGVLEVAAHREWLLATGLRVGDVLRANVPGGRAKTLTVRIVGGFDLSEDAPANRFPGRAFFQKTLIADPAALRSALEDGILPLQLGRWLFIYDLAALDSARLEATHRFLAGLNVELERRLPRAQVESSFADRLDAFRGEYARLQAMLVALIAPVVVLLADFLFTTGRFLIDGEAHEITLLLGRGARKRQIVALYLAEATFAWGIALLPGLLAAFGLARLLGQASGFLQFVRRSPIRLALSPELLLYAGGVLVLAVAIRLFLLRAFFRAGLMPAGRRQRGRIAAGIAVDALLIAAAGYGAYALGRTPAASAGVGFDPLLVLAPAAASYGLIRLFLRLYPAAMRLGLRLLGRVALPLELALTTLARAPADALAVMRLIAFTLALGLYSAGAAATLRTNWEADFLLRTGADAVLRAQWETAIDPTSLLAGGSGSGGAGEAPAAGLPPGGPAGGAFPGGEGGPGPGDGDRPTVRTVFIEPPFERFRHLPGVEAEARVLVRDVAASIGTKSLGKGTLMAIDNVDFARTARFVPELYRPHHPVDYLRLLGRHAAALLVSESFLKRAALKPGDVLTLSIDREPAEFIVFAGVPYWPALPSDRPFFIANLPYVEEVWPLEPYDIWLRLGTDGRLADAVQALLDADIPLVEVIDWRSKGIREQKSPYQAGVFGTLSLDFLIAALTAFAGYGLITAFSLSRRAPTFSLLRASGLTKAELFASLAAETLFIVVPTLGLGLVTGTASARLYLPFLQGAFSSGERSLPFRLVFRPDDVALLVALTAATVVLAGAVAVRQVFRLRLAETLKFGAER
ncbi:MAG: FtsX-like permease family protein [Hydrogenibacillus schlegelii]|uniref:FtsX-like permease family protein n=1 Tax=Hydrogenibacillus schlegelii TaxID=1484 RepID=A0A947D1E7_HYDSH|nr:FtsX-like permease family protein [Hydrogenibacillus schlegelii]